MIKLLSASLAGFFWTACAFAVEAEPEMEKADPFTVVAFLILFFGGIAWYIGRTIRNHKKAKEK